jgi:hypothetical protein
MNFQHITAELESIADQLQSKGQVKLARRVDIITNTIEVASKNLKKASPNDMMPKGPDMNPGSEDSDENARLDAFEATHYHRVPVGKDSMSSYLGAPSPADMELDFAQQDMPIHIQSSKKKASPENGIDEGDINNDYSTAGLPESGNEKRNPPVDVNQVGSDLELFGFQPAGTLHMPGKGKPAKTETPSEEKAQEDAPKEDSKKKVSTAQKVLQARKTLMKAATEVIIEDPADMHMGQNKSVKKHEPKSEDESKEDSEDSEDTTATVEYASDEE